MKKKTLKELKTCVSHLYIIYSFDISREITDVSQRKKLNRKRGVRVLNSEALRSDRT